VRCVLEPRHERALLVQWWTAGKNEQSGGLVADVNELKRRVFSRPWFHRIDLGNGIVTPGIDDSVQKLGYLDFPADLSGKTALDIGAYDGFFSFEAERRGATRVVAADYFCWTRTGMGDKQGFNIAHTALNSKVEAVLIPVEEMSPEKLGMFDLVLFLGVLYHSQDPLRYLRIVRSLCKHQLILETHVDAIDYPRPAMVFYPGATLNNDSSNFWGPNPQAVEAMLLEVGFSRVEKKCTYGTRLVVHAFV
jgi:tRNA (mo5U34)-methyltransferase